MYFELHRQAAPQSDYIAAAFGHARWLPHDLRAPDVVRARWWWVPKVDVMDAGVTAVATTGDE